MATLVLRFEVPDGVPTGDLLEEAEGIATGVMTVPVDYRIREVVIGE